MCVSCAIVERTQTDYVPSVGSAVSIEARYLNIRKLKTGTIKFRFCTETFIKRYRSTFAIRQMVFNSPDLLTDS